MTPDRERAVIFRLGSRVVSRIDAMPDIGCWLWSGGTASGYGVVYLGGMTVSVPRAVLAEVLGRPLRAWALHTCDVKVCVRPTHLYEGTRFDNARDACARGQQPAGDRHGSRTRPDRRSHGDAHGMRLHPERVPRGERSGTAVLTENDVIQIRKARARGVLLRTLSAEYGVAESCISRVATGVRWAHVGGLQ